MTDNKSANMRFSNESCVPDQTFDDLKIVLSTDQRTLVCAGGKGTSDIFVPILAEKTLSESKMTVTFQFTKSEGMIQFGILRRTTRTHKEVGEHRHPNVEYINLFRSSSTAEISVYTLTADTTSSVKMIEKALSKDGKTVVGERDYDKVFIGIRNLSEYIPFVAFTPAKCKDVNVTIQ